MTKARLFCRWGDLKGTEYELGPDSTVGRGAGNTVVLDEATVSERHARIYFDDEQGGATSWRTSTASTAPTWTGSP